MAKKGNRPTSDEARELFGSERRKQKLRKKSGKWRQLGTRPYYLEFNLRRALRDCLLGYWRTGSNTREILQFDEIEDALANEGFILREDLASRVFYKGMPRIIGNEVWKLHINAIALVRREQIKSREPSKSREQIKFGERVKSKGQAEDEERIEDERQITWRDYEIFVYRLFGRLTDEEIAVKVGLKRRRVNTILADLRKKIDKD